MMGRERRAICALVACGLGGMISLQAHAQETPASEPEQETVPAPVPEETEGKVLESDESVSPAEDNQRKISLEEFEEQSGEIEHQISEISKQIEGFRAARARLDEQSEAGVFSEEFQGNIEKEISRLDSEIDDHQSQREALENQIKRLWSRVDRLSLIHDESQRTNELLTGGNEEAEETNRLLRETNSLLREMLNGQAGLDKDEQTTRNTSLESPSHTLSVHAPQESRVLSPEENRLESGDPSGPLVVTLFLELEDGKRKFAKNVLASSIRKEGDTLRFRIYSREEEMSLRIKNFWRSFPYQSNGPVERVVIGGRMCDPRFVFLANGVPWAVMHKEDGEYTMAVLN